MSKSTEHKSSALLEEMNNIEIDGNIKALKLFNLAVATVMAMGIIEHEGDWDPWLRLNLKTGVEIDSAHGYEDMEINEELGTVKITVEEMDENDETIYHEEYIAIALIETISIYR